MQSINKIHYIVCEFCLKKNFFFSIHFQNAYINRAELKLEEIRKFHAHCAAQYYSREYGTFMNIGDTH